MQAEQTILVCRVTTAVSVLLGLKPEQLIICDECSKAGWQLFPCRWCRGTAIVPETRTLTTRFNKVYVIAQAGDSCRMCYGTGKDSDRVQKLECGCVRRSLLGRDIEKCAVHQIGTFACCAKAQRTPCVCFESFTCPEHGEKHVGTHD